MGERSKREMGNRYRVIRREGKDIWREGERGKRENGKKIKDDSLRRTQRMRESVGEKM